MKPIKNAILSIASGLFLFGISFSIVMADVTYTYTGQKDSVTSNRIVGSFTLPIPLIPNKAYEYTPVTVFSFSDGRTRFTDRNTTKSRAGFANGFWLETNVKGDLKSWDIQLFIFDPEPPEVNSRVKGLVTIHNPFLGGAEVDWDQSYYGTCLEVRNNNCNSVFIIDDVLINLGHPGTWKITNDNASPSPQTGFQLSKKEQFLGYGARFIPRGLQYLPFAEALVSVCPVTGGSSCVALGVAATGAILYEGYEIGKIIKDPPDPLYSEIFLPRQYPAFILDSSSGFSQELIDAANDSFRDRAELASLLEAWRVTLERYSAAQAANDQLNMRRQEVALNDYIIQTSRLATLTQQSFDEFLDQLEELTGPITISPSQMHEATNNLAINGFSQPVLDHLSSFGLGSAEIEELRSTLLQAPPLSDMVDFYSSMRSTEGSYGELSALTRYVAENNLLTVIKTGTGNGTVTSNPPGIDCGETCSASFDSGASVSLAATPAADSTFVGWSPTSCGSAFSLTADTTCTATFNLANRPPVAKAGLAQTVECAGPSGTNVTLDGSASSDPDGDVPLAFTWTGPFGTATGSNPTVALPLGTHTITLTVDDGHGGTATDTVVVRVVDTTPPVLNLPANISTAATDASGAAVTYTASATDLVDGAVTPNCTPASGSVFPIGTTTVSCTATDKAENTASGSFKVTVVGTTPPSSTPFSAFSVNSLRINQRLKTLFLLSNFTLGQGNNGIDPTKEPVTLTVAGFTTTIPAGSFRKGSGPFGVYAFIGKINNVAIEMLIAPLGNNRFGFQVAAYGASLSGTKNPVTVVLLIGDDSGTAMLNNAIIR